MEIDLLVNNMVICMLMGRFRGRMYIKGMVTGNEGWGRSTWYINLGI